MAQVLLNSPLLEQLANSLELHIRGDIMVCRLAIPAPVVRQRSLHREPVLDREVGVHLSYILDKKTRV